jgi:16S rRNA C967 or C1407 C5-methylase (RsmB/RsmF family)
MEGDNEDFTDLNEKELDQEFKLSGQLSDNFKEFIRRNNIPEDAYDIKTLSRFIRINPLASVTVDQIQTELKITLEPLDWLPGFYKIPANFKLASTQSYKDGHIYGIDASSGAVVAALDPEPGDHVLDLCCAPGAKLCMIGSIMQHKYLQKPQNDTCQVSNNAPREHSGSVTGVDIAAHRLAAAKTLVKKYHVPNVRLFEADATTFDVLAPLLADTTETVTPPQLMPLPWNTSNAAPNNNNGEVSEGQQYEKTAPNKRRKLNKKKHKDNLPGLLLANHWKLRQSSVQLYDKILLDAQCTLDASIRHVLLFHKVGWKEFDTNIESTTTQLQQRMIFNAFRLLKPGGVLVYSTCSFSTAQNEEIVTWLLTNEPKAEVVPITFAGVSPAVEGSLQHTLRFYPKSTGTSGIFIARIRRKIE